MIGAKYSPANRANILASKLNYLVAAIFSGPHFCVIDFFQLRANYATGFA
jgi:hypothetical protein